ncbi:MAG: spore coat associated protein CotJA [Ruminococcus sp.]|nr:spore coat associated protein CotJA [Ruminococcus sp.]
MNLDLFNNIDGLVLRENGSAVPYADRTERMDMNAQSDMPAAPQLAMAYVPFQQWGDTMEADKALSCGTLFSDLVFPFERGGGR